MTQSEFRILHRTFRLPENRSFCKFWLAPESERQSAEPEWQPAVPEWQQAEPG